MIFKLLQLNNAIFSYFLLIPLILQLSITVNIIANNSCPVIADPPWCIYGTVKCTYSLHWWVYLPFISL